MPDVDLAVVNPFKPTPAPAKAGAPCVVCGHPEAMHCKGNVSHAWHKDVIRMVRNARKAICHNRHCEAPLCSCTNYRAS